MYRINIYLIIQKINCRKPENAAGNRYIIRKTVHAVMKNYYAPDTDMHEIPIENFVADIYTGRRSSRSRQGHLIKCGGSLTLFCHYIRSRSFIQFPISSGCRGLTRKPGRLHRNASHQRPEIPIWHLLSSIRSALFIKSKSAFKTGAA